MHPFRPWPCLPMGVRAHARAEAASVVKFAREKRNDTSS